MSDPSTTHDDRDDVEDPTTSADPGAAHPQSEPDVDPDPEPDAELDATTVGDVADAPVPTDAGPDQDAADGDAETDPLENEGEIAADYLEDLLDIADLDGDLDMDVEGDRASVSIVGGDVRHLVGSQGEVLEALQELTRLAVYRETGVRSRLMLDIGGFRADKRSRLERLAVETVEKVRATGERMPLDPMTPFERKVVHDAVADAGLASESEGEEPRRYVVVLPA